MAQRNVSFSVNVVPAANENGSYIANITSRGVTKQFVAQNFADAKAILAKFVEAVEEPSAPAEPKTQP